MRFLGHLTWILMAITLVGPGEGLAILRRLLEGSDSCGIEWSEGVQPYCRVRYEQVSTIDILLKGEYFSV